MKVLITGATGFIGSNIAGELLERGVDLYATYRNTSSFDKCILFKDEITWINTDNPDWKDKILNIKPDQLIHAAWSGIKSEDRNDWSLQISNFWLSKTYFDLAKECGVKKVIVLGSQAEYGVQGCAADENTNPMPNDAYGSVKLLTGNYLRNLFDDSNTAWYWLRVYSVFGEGENPDWLIPSIVSRLLKNEPIQLTRCEQRYNYLYIKDFTAQLLSVVECEENKSGIYNICDSEDVVLKDLVSKIADLSEISQKLLQYGTLPYRNGQNMFISGNNTKFRTCFKLNGKPSFGLAKGLMKTIEYYKGKLS
ncbi:MAG: NAD(P)-dependent oxidoreductase [Bacteroidales bacterium]